MDGPGLTPLAGGFSGETFLAESAGERVVVRIYAGRGARRGRAATEIDAAVLHLAVAASGDLHAVARRPI